MRSILRRRLRPPPFAAVGFAFFCILVATALRLGADYLVGPGLVPMAPFYPAVMIATLIAGYEAGLIALVASVLLGWWAFTEPFFSWRIDSPADTVSLVIFSAALALIVWTADAYRRAVERLEEEEHQREMIVAELGHRVKNKLSTVYALLRIELRPYPEIWKKVEARMRSLAATDDFVVRGDGQGATLRELLLLTLAPYDTSRLKLRLDEDVLIPPKTATILALMFHELTTNAAKHGALLSDHGQIAVSSRVSGQQIDIDWVESGGPTVTAPKHHGFGTTFLDRGLKPYRGQVELKFEERGLICHMSFELPERPKRAAPESTQTAEQTADAEA